MKIQAAVLNAIGAKTPYAESMPLSIDTLGLDGPAYGEVLVKIGAAGLCHSDLSAGMPEMVESGFLAIAGRGREQQR